MNKKVLENAVFFALGIFLGFMIFSPAENIMTEHNMEMSTAQKMNMEEMKPHAMTEIDKSLPIPTVGIEFEKDKMDGYNLHFVTENYTFTPEKVNTEPIPGEGHAHVYVNGVKVARVYGEWFHLSSSDLRDGPNEVEVTLNANDHSEWVIDGLHISSVITLEN